MSGVRKKVKCNIVNFSTNAMVILPRGRFLYLLNREDHYLSCLGEIQHNWPFKPNLAERKGE